jgi:hypothetical protein
MAKQKKEDEVEERDPDTGGLTPLEPLEAEGLPKGAHESKPVYDPVDDYPPRSLDEARAGVHQVIPHTEEGRYDSLQLVQDAETGELTHAEGVEGMIVNHDYIEEVVMVDGQKVGYFAPKYD